SSLIDVTRTGRLSRLPTPSHTSVSPIGENRLASNATNCHTAAPSGICAVIDMTTLDVVLVGPSAYHTRVTYSSGRSIPAGTMSGTDCHLIGRIRRCRLTARPP